MQLEGYFGERIEGTAACRDCREPFESSFSLRDLMASLEVGAAAKATGPDEEGIYTLHDGRRFRLPTAGDQRSVLGLEAEKAAAALLERCVVEGDPRRPSYRLPWMRWVKSSTLTWRLPVPSAVRCRACGLTSRLTCCALAYQRRFLNHEVHRIAMAYGWGHEEILNLTREDRRAFVRMIEAERVVRRRVRA
jgi:hypothetical protein